MDWLNNTYGALSSAPSWLAYPAALLLVLLPIYSGARLWQFAAVTAATLWLMGAPLWLG